MFIIDLPTRIRIDIIQWFSLTTEITLSIQFSLGRTSTPPKPELSPLHMNLYITPFTETNLAEKPFQPDSWIQHISICLRPTVSTTSLVLPSIVPTFHARNLHILHTWCGRWMTVWIGPHLTFLLSGTTPSLLDMTLLYHITLFDILQNLIEAESFTAGCSSWRKPVGRPGNNQKTFIVIFTALLFLRLIQGLFFIWGGNVS